METRSVDGLERVARNLPVKSLTMDRVETKYGPVRFGYGQDGAGIFHGIYAVQLGEKDIARTLEFKPDTKEGDVQVMLLMEGGSLLKHFYEDTPMNGDAGNGI